MKTLHIAIVLVGTLLTVSGVSAQSQDSIPLIQDSISLTQDSIQKRASLIKRIYKYFEGSNEDKTLTKKIDFSIIGGPHYSSDIGFGIGLVAAGLYRIDRNDLSIAPSNVSLFGDITTTGFYLLGVRGNTIIKSGKYRVDYNAYFFSMPSLYWGIGYENGMHNKETVYQRLQNNVKGDFLYRVAKNTYIGANASFSYIEGKDFKDISYLNGVDRSYVTVGVGVTALYDSRDFIPNAHSGYYAKIEQRFFPGPFGNKGSFARTEVFMNYYHPLWKGGVMAYDLHAEMNSGSVPWTQLALMGSSNRMRGYYEGRYRDRNLVEIQAELRQKVYGRSGVAVWVGGGNVFPSLKKFDFSKTLPNYGIGYRWEFKNRINVRLDYGFGRNQSGFIFNINEAF